MERNYSITELVGFNNIPWEKAYKCLVSENGEIIYRSILVMGDIDELLYTEQLANIPAHMITPKAWVNRVYEYSQLAW
jgi:hypothetical protein